MSLVGPLPERPEFVGQLEKALPRYRERLMVLPGITGLAQVQLKSDDRPRKRGLQVDLRSSLYSENERLARSSDPGDHSSLPSGNTFPVLHWLFRVPAFRTLECTCIGPRNSGRFRRYFLVPRWSQLVNHVHLSFPSGAFRAGSHSSEKIQGLAAADHTMTNAEIAFNQTLHVIAGHAPRPLPTVIRPRRGWQAVNLVELWKYRELLFFSDLARRQGEVQADGAWERPGRFSSL